MDTRTDTKDRKLALYQRVLALKHKLKVHDTMPMPETHEESARAQIARWDLEDELHAIEEILRDLRKGNVEVLKKLIEKQGPKKKSKKTE